MSEKEIDDVHRYCDVDSRKGIQFQEFVVLLCLMYLLFSPDVTRRVSEFESVKLNYVFDELIDAFLFFNKDGDGTMRRKDVTKRMNDTSPQDRTPSHITTQLFRRPCGLDFSQQEDVRYSFGMFSVKFSTDGRELVAGSNDESIYVYDLQANKLTSCLPAHSVCLLIHYDSLFIFLGQSGGRWNVVL